MAELNTVRTLAAEVRERVISRHPNPKGECYEASLALGLLIVAKCQSSTVFLCKGSLHSNLHWWLEIHLGAEKFVLDITADQFNDEGYNFPPICLLNGKNSITKKWRYEEKTCFFEEVVAFLGMS